MCVPDTETSVCMYQIQRRAYVVPDTETSVCMYQIQRRAYVCTRYGDERMYVPDTRRAYVVPDTETSVCVYQIQRRAYVCTRYRDERMCVPDTETSVCVYQIQRRERMCTRYRDERMHVPDIETSVCVYQIRRRAYPTVSIHRIPRQPELTSSMNRQRDPCPSRSLSRNFCCDLAPSSGPPARPVYRAHFSLFTGGDNLNKVTVTGAEATDEGTDTATIVHVQTAVCGLTCGS
ncbi:hypothetical protein J6590_036140 [Homalodisca vitripennis]|nr:hypothetical protein J6590_036140 [Homalodisca vitripennis]